MPWTHDRLRAADRVAQEGPWQRKLNGHRLTLFGQPDGSVLAFGRTVRPDLELSERLSACAWFPRRMPAMTSVDGELVTESDRASDVRGAEPHELGFIAFAVPWWRGEYLADEPTARNVRRAGELSLCPATTYAWTSHPEDIASRRGWEGYVVHESAYRGWWRWKPTRTRDAVVSRLVPGTGLHRGEVGSLEVVDPDTRAVLGRVAGMTDSERASARVGRLLEVEYQAIGSRGRMLHPRFTRWRDDE